MVPIGSSDHCEGGWALARLARPAPVHANRSPVARADNQKHGLADVAVWICLRHACCACAALLLFLPVFDPMHAAMRQWAVFLSGPAAKRCVCLFRRALWRRAESTRTQAASLPSCEACAPTRSVADHAPDDAKCRDAPRPHIATPCDKQVCRILPTDSRAPRRAGKEGPSPSRHSARGAQCGSPMVVEERRAVYFCVRARRGERATVVHARCFVALRSVVVRKGRDESFVSWRTKVR